jgi:uncharacterized membrane protein
MLESAFLLVGVLAFGWTLVTLYAAVAARSDDKTGDAVAMMAGVVGFVIWGVWTFGTLNVDVVTDSGSIVTVSNPELTLLGIVMALVPGYIALTGPIDLIYRAVDEPGQRDI